MIEQAIADLFSAAISQDIMLGLLIIINVVLWRKLNQVESKLYECLDEN